MAVILSWATKISVRKMALKFWNCVKNNMDNVCGAKGIAIAISVSEISTDSNV